MSGSKESAEQHTMNILLYIIATATADMQENGDILYGARSLSITILS